MEKHIPEGYKQTEVGIFPEDWVEKRIGDIFDFKNGLNKDKEYFGYGIPIINYMDVYKNSSILGKNLKGRVSLNKNEIETYKVNKGDVFFTRTSETVEEIGMSAVLLEDSSDTVFSGFLLRARPRNQILDLEFCKYCFSHKQIRRQILQKASFTTRALTNGKLLSRVILLIPPTKTEQQSIATALSDVDNLISSLEQLIEKKKAIKQGAMQELLSGRRRLRGFGEGKGYKQTELGLIPEDWEVVRLGDYCSITTGKKDVNEGSENGLYPFFTCSRTPSSSNSFSFNTEAILIAGNGDVGNLHYYKGKFEAYQRTYVVSEFEMSVAYIYHYLMNNLVKSLMSGTIGTSIPYIKKENLTDFSILLQKSSEEQLAIARVLSDMDSEIEDLETKVDKYKQIKQGMMQNLLTGRIRLV